MARRQLTVCPDQRRELEDTRDRDHRAYLREIAAALLKIADGMAPYAVARHGLHKPRKPETVYRWLTKYEQGGLAALVHRPRGHRGFSPSARRGDPGAAAPAAGRARLSPPPLAADRSARVRPVPARV